jgi:hypothetical protein
VVALLGAVALRRGVTCRPHAPAGVDTAEASAPPVTV